MGRKGRMEKPKFGLPRVKKEDNEEGKDEILCSCTCYSERKDNAATGSMAGWRHEKE
jgi:hypothetical protein